MTMKITHKTRKIRSSQTSHRASSPASSTSWAFARVRRHLLDLEVWTVHRRAELKTTIHLLKSQTSTSRSRNQALRSTCMSQCQYCTTLNQRLLKHSRLPKVTSLHQFVCSIRCIKGSWQARNLRRRSWQHKGVSRQRSRLLATSLGRTVESVQLLTDHQLSKQEQPKSLAKNTVVARSQAPTQFRPNHKHLIAQSEVKDSNKSVKKLTLSHRCSSPTNNLTLCRGLNWDWSNAESFESNRWQ